MLQRSAALRLTGGQCHGGDPLPMSLVRQPVAVPTAIAQLAASDPSHYS